jgi:hypothetical protein
VFLARHLKETIGGPDLAWWQLQKVLPREAFTFATNLAGWLLAALVFGVIFASDPHLGGAIVGLALGVVSLFGLELVFRLAGAPGGVEAPARGMRIRVSGLVVGSVLGLIVGGQFGLSVGLVVGFAAVLAGGLAAVPDHLARVTSPRAVLARDRQIMLFFILAGGLVGGLFFWLIFGLRFGPVGLVFGLLVGFARSMNQTAWPTYTLTKAWLVVNHELPWRLMSFLSDAHQRGVLRQIGVVYQFRHIELQHRLANRDASEVDVNSPTAPAAADA